MKTSLTRIVAAAVKESAPAAAAIATLVIATLVAAPTVALAQAHAAPVTLVAVKPITGIGACSTRDDRRSATWQRFLEARALHDDAEARGIFVALADTLRAEAAVRPTDVEAQYALAAVLGAYAEAEGGRAKIRAAKALHEQLEVVFALDPRHPGAHHLLGRLHAAVRRMDGLTRFVATRFFGAGALSDASWAEARRGLEVAVMGDPCVPDHHYQLARLYAERGDPVAARERLEGLLALPRSGQAYSEVFEQGRALLEALEGQH